MSLDISLARGATILNDAILQQLAALPAGSSVAVLGYSQSAVLSSRVMPKLLAEGVTSSQVNFVLLGNPMNPNGGVLARFPDLTLPSLGFTFYGATPDNAFPTVSYTLEYDASPTSRATRSTCLPTSTQLWVSRSCTLTIRISRRRSSTQPFSCQPRAQPRARTT